MNQATPIPHPAEQPCLRAPYQTETTDCPARQEKAVTAEFGPVQRGKFIFS